MLNSILVLSVVYIACSLRLVRKRHSIILPMHHRQTLLQWTVHCWIYYHTKINRSGYENIIAVHIRLAVAMTRSGHENTCRFPHRTRSSHYGKLSPAQHTKFPWYSGHFRKKRYTWKYPCQFSTDFNKQGGHCCWWTPPVSKLFNCYVASPVSPIKCFSSTKSFLSSCGIVVVAETLRKRHKGNNSRQVLAREQSVYVDE